MFWPFKKKESRIPIQINGIKIGYFASDIMVDNIINDLNGRRIDKVVVVPDRVINLVVDWRKKYE